MVTFGPLAGFHPKQKDFESTKKTNQFLAGFGLPKKNTKTSPLTKSPPFETHPPAASWAPSKVALPRTPLAVFEPQAA